MLAGSAALGAFALVWVGRRRALLSGRASSEQFDRKRLAKTEPSRHHLA